MRRTCLTLILTLALGAPSHAFLARNDLTVTPRGEGFHVAWYGRSGAPAFWCAAGDYVIRGLGLPTGTRIYRVSPPPRRQGEGISFGFTASDAAPSGLFRIATSRGMSAALAQRYCERDEDR